MDLKKEPLVGVGSVCRRQATTRAAALIHTLRHVDGLSLHGFGWKKSGLLASADDLASADSLAWSYAARRRPPLPECVGRHAACNNCLTYALRWRERILCLLGQTPAAECPDPQGTLF